DVWQAIDKLGPSDIKEAASRHIYDREIAVSGVGCTEAFPIYQALRAGMSWWRL
ncbi:hypothetical protein AAVH_30025, partial [Aphelenchoides avenae]